MLSAAIAPSSPDKVPITRIQLAKPTTSTSGTMTSLRGRKGLGGPSPGFLTAASGDTRSRLCGAGRHTPPGRSGVPKRRPVPRCRAWRLVRLWRGLWDPAQARADRGGGNGTASNPPPHRAAKQSSVAHTAGQRAQWLPGTAARSPRGRREAALRTGEAPVVSRVWAPIIIAG